MSTFSIYHLRRIARTNIEQFKFRQALRDRRRFASVQANSVAADPLARDGFLVQRAHFDVAMLEDIRGRVDAEIDRNGSLLPVANDSIRPVGERSPATVTVPKSDIERGQDVLRNLTNFVAIRDPLLVVPEILDIALDENVLDIVSSYFGCLPALSGINLRKSYVNQLPEFDTNLYHVDGNSPNFLKLFVYLNNVDTRGGPTEIVKGSHTRKPLNWRHQYRWTRAELEPFYGPDAFVELTANLGDFQIANTTTFHRGKKVESQDRYMLTLNYSIHPEYFSNRAPAALVDRDRAEAISASKRPVLDYCKLV